MTSVSEKNKWKALAFSTPDPFSFHHLSRASLGLCDWRHLWTLLLRHVQEGRQESLAIFLMHALADMFWLESHVSLDPLGKLIL